MRWVWVFASGLLLGLTNCAAYAPIVARPDYAAVEWGGDAQPAQESVVRRQVSRADVQRQEATMQRTTNSRASMDERAEVKPFTKAWYDQESAYDARLRRHLDICRVC